MAARVNIVLPYGEFGHIASECAKNLKAQGNEYRQPRRRGLAGKSISRQCNYCLKNLNKNFWRCKCCKLVSYCNQTYQRGNWPYHKTLCNAIKREVKRTTQVSQDKHSEVFMSRLSQKENEKLISLVGQRCTVTGKINGKTVEVLWDTGAQVSIVSAKFLKENFQKYRYILENIDGTFRDFS